MLDTDHYVRFERVDAVAETDRGLTADLHDEHLRVDVVRPDLVRLKISRGRRFEEEPTHAVCVDPLAEPVDFTVTREGGRVLLTTGRLVVTLWLDPFRLDVHRVDGTPVVETAADEAGRYWAYATLNDAFTVRRRCGPPDAIFGLGEKGGPHNRRGRDFTMWNTDVLSPYGTLEFTRDKAPGDPRGDRTSVEFDPFYLTVPFFYHQRADGTMTGSFLDNGYRAGFEFTAPEEYRIWAAGGQYTEYVFAGPEMRDILADYTWLTGRTALPPLWALGYHQCRWFAYTQDAVEAIGRRHRAEEVPLDALWLDIDYMAGYRVFTWDEQRFPDPSGMVARLADDGVKVVTIVDPGVKRDPGYSVYDQGREQDLFCRTEGGDVYLGQVWPGETAFPDFVTPEARRWWGALTAAHLESGVAGIWNDMNEPATGSIPPEPMRFGRGRYSHGRYHNQYALLMAMATHEGLAEADPERRPFVLSRAGFAGIQRYAATWTGDNLARWDHLRLSIAMGAGLGVSGQPFVGADIGGFRGDCTAELFSRWMQYGVLTPFCRNHAEKGSADQYAWAFGPEVLDRVRAAVRMRYRLLPYLYTAFVRAAESGEPVQRPLVFDHQYDEAVRDLDDQYLLGRDLLVAPVLAAGVTRREVYLPAGDWYDWHTGEALRGPARVLAAAPPERIPVYARGGSVVPMWPQAPPSTRDHHPETVELRLFVPTADGTTTSLLVEDDGVTVAARGGAQLRTTVEVTRTGSRLAVSATAAGDGYPEFRRQSFRLVPVGTPASRLRVADVEVARADGGFTVADRGSGFTAELDL